MNSEETPLPQAGVKPDNAVSTLIDARMISRTFGAVQALTDVSLEFNKGEVHGLVGANGAGKSTFLNILAGAVTPTSGLILLDGVEVAINRPAQADALGFAFIPQELALVPDFSAIDNMTLACSSRRMRFLASRNSDSSTEVAPGFTPSSTSAIFTQRRTHDSEIPTSFAICAKDVRRRLAIATTSSRNSFGNALGTIDILPAATLIATNSEPPQPSAVPDESGEPYVSRFPP